MSELDTEQNERIRLVESRINELENQMTECGSGEGSSSSECEYEVSIGDVQDTPSINGTNGTCVTIEIEVEGDDEETVDDVLDILMSPEFWGTVGTTLLGC